MADRKISALAQLATPDDTDYLPIVDVSEPAEADKNKRVLWSRILPRSGGNVTGNITADAGVLIDGRDLSVDGTKLDLLTVTQAVDLDTIESRVNELDAAVVLKGSWDASVGTFPGGGTAQAGDSYIVSVGGTVDGIEFTVNDRIVAITDNASTATYAANWLKLDYTDQVLSVAGLTGAISDSALRTAINVEDGATADQSDAEIATAYQTAVPLISQAAAEAGTATGIESWSALRVAQAIAALGGGGAFSADAQTQITPATPIVLDEATGDEVALDLSVTVNKATSGNYTLIKANATETSAPGSDDRLLDLQVGGTTINSVSNGGMARFATASNAYITLNSYGGAAPAVAGGVLGFTTGGARVGYILFDTHRSEGSALNLWADGGNILLKGGAGGVSGVHVTFNGAYTVATLPTAAVGKIARVSDADTPAVGSTVVGGGASPALVWYNSSAWTVIGV